MIVREERILHIDCLEEDGSGPAHDPYLCIEIDARYADDVRSTGEPYVEIKVDGRKRPFLVPREGIVAILELLPEPPAVGPAL
jgi:hypothetical protein